MIVLIVQSVAFTILNVASWSICQVDGLWIDIEGSIPHRAIGEVLDLSVVDPWVTRFNKVGRLPWLNMTGCHRVVVK